MALPHVDPNAPRSVLYRTYTRLLGTRLAGWVSRTFVWRLDPHLMRLSRGRIGAGLMLPTALLETRGARTGAARSNVVIYFHDGERVTLIASKLGAPENPAWFHNARANGNVVFGGLPFSVEVIEEEAERERIWALADKVFPVYADYRERAGKAGRTIPIVQLVPARSD